MSPMDRISADGLGALLQMCETRLTVITSCDSVALASMLISASHLVASPDMVSSKMMAAWVEAFYETLPHRHYRMRDSNWPNQSGYRSCERSILSCYF